MPVGIVQVDKTGIILYQNDCATGLLGDLLSRKIESVLTGFPAHIFTADDQQFPFSFSANPNGGKIHVNCKVKKSPDGNIWMSISEGDTQLKQLRAIETKKNAAESLLRSAVISGGTLDEALTEICRVASGTLEVSRVNIWEFGNEMTSITSLLNYDGRFTELKDNVTLYRYQIPKYFSLFETEEIIPTKDALNDPETSELRVYLEVNGIRALMDVPVRISGKMVGLVCFEDTTKTREWDSGEQKFGLFLAQVIALTIETSRRKKTQKELELILDEKRILLNEIHRRVRNNFALIQDLLRAEGLRAHDDYHRDLFKDLRNRINSLDMLQRQLYQSEKVDRVNFRDLVLDLVAGYRATFSGRDTDFITTLDQCELNVAKASIAGLLLNEIMMMLLGEDARAKDKESISIRLKKINSRVHLSIASSILIDNVREQERMLTSFEMAEKLGSKLEIDHRTGTGYQITFEA